MSNEKSKGKVLSLKQLSTDALGRIIAFQKRGILGKNEQLKDLTRKLNESEEKRQNLQTKSDNYENALRRAEKRIAYLNKKLEIGPQSTFGIDVVSSEISRKDKENQELYELIGTLRKDLAQSEHHVKELKVNAENTSAMNAQSNKEQEKIVEEKDKEIAEQVEVICELLAEVEISFKKISELSSEAVKMNEEKRKAEHEFIETKKKCSDSEKKCAGLFNQVVSLNSKQQESEEEISSLKRACENLHAQLAEKEDMMVMMRDSLKTCEDDFRREREEKASVQKRMESTQQEIERLKREIQLNDASENQTPLLVTDDGNEASTSTTSHQGNAAAMVSPVLVECPLCSSSFPLLLIENHIQDCMDYKDYNTGAL